MRYADVLMLAEMAARGTEGRSELRRILSKSRDAKLRRRILGLIRPETPGDFIDQMISIGLRDADARVREMAVGTAEMLRRVTMVSRLRERIEEETDSSVSDCIEECVSLLTQGYVIRKSDAEYWLSVLADSGGRASRMISRTEMESASALQLEINRLRRS